MDIPEEFKDLPGISDVEIKEMIEEGKVDIKNRVVRGIAIRTLHGAIFQGIPVKVIGSFIDGRLDFWSGKPIPLEKVKEIGPEVKRWLEDRGASKVVVLNAPINMGKGTHIKGPVRADNVVFLRGVYFNSTNFLKETSFSGTVFCDEASFESAKFRKGGDFSEANFGGGVSFERATFGERAIFGRTTFGERASFERATFGERAIFGRTTFGERASFEGATFGERASFWWATFRSGASFRRATFRSGAIFGRTTFGERASFKEVAFGERAFFEGATFGAGASFWRATFKGAVVFQGKRDEIPVFEGEVNLQEVIFKAPHEVKFQHVSLIGARFLNTRLDKVQFVDVDWAKPERGERKTLYDEVSHEPQVKNYELVAQLYRQLKKNYEEQRDYPTAGDFHYGEMEMTRLQQGQEWKEESKWLLKAKKLFAWFLTRSYKFLSGYGEKAEWAIVIALAILLVPAICYYAGNMTLNHPTKFLRDFMDYAVQSLGYMTFRIHETPIQGWAKAFMVFQAILGPIQLALTALALRRKFRR